MTYSMRMLIQPGDALGFRLAGVPVEEVPPGAVATRLRELTGDPSLGIIVLDERLLPSVPADVSTRLSRTGIPVLLPFGVPQRFTEGGRGEAYVAALIRRSIGYHVKVPTRGEQ